MQPSVIVESGLYESACGCRAKCELRQGQRPPPCPICEAEVTWVLKVPEERPKRQPPPSG